jgi:hypothetical protein
MTPGREEEWTLSITHTDEAIDAYVACFDEMAHDLIGAPLVGVEVPAAVSTKGGKLGLDEGARSLRDSRRPDRS